MKQRDHRGYTLLELVAVLLLIGLVAAVAVPKVIDLLGPSKKSLTEKEMLNLKRAVVGNPDLVAAGGYTQRGYEGDVGALPSALSDLVTKPAAVPSWDPWNKKGWNGPYIDDQSGGYLQDAWGTNYAYNRSARTITSYGPDRAAGGGDDIVVQF
jgi:general secretion pathway protein G